MKTFYDVSVEFIREEVYTVQADSWDDAVAKAEEMAERYADGHEVKVVAVSPNLENPPF